MFFILSVDSSLNCNSTKSHNITHLRTAVVMFLRKEVDENKEEISQKKSSVSISFHWYKRQKKKC
jgi:hypothetical protein